MKVEHFLSLIHERTTIEDIGEFNQAALFHVPLMEHYIEANMPQLFDELERSISIAIGTIELFANSPNVVFQTVCQLLVFLQRAEEQGYSEEQLLKFFKETE